MNGWSQSPMRFTMRCCKSQTLLPIALRCDTPHVLEETGKGGWLREVEPIAYLRYGKGCLAEQECGLHEQHLVDIALLLLVILPTWTVYKFTEER